MKIGHVLKKKKIDLMMKKWGLNVYVNQAFVMKLSSYILN
jgi:hypothetical protein